MSRTYDTKEYQDANKIFLFKNRGLPKIDFGQLMIDGNSREEIDTIMHASRHQEVQAFMEEKGQPDNRVQLAPGTNRFGLPKMKIHFTRTEKASDNAEAWLKIMEKIVIDMGYTTHSTDPTLRREVQSPGGHHATGTCRMSETPETGVTTGDMRVHGTDNLYVCSNASFPSGAAVNPTLTLAAMAMRLVDHLIKRKGGSASAKLSAQHVTAEGV